MRVSFSGHDTFPCRQFWPKKGYDFVKAGKQFNSEDAVVELGVGKNMVSAIRYWMKAMDLLTSDDKLTELAVSLLDDDGWDPYLEDETSLWILHYHLVKKGFASSYGFLFNELRKEKIEFNREAYIGYLKRKSEATGSFVLNAKTALEDFGVLSKMYIPSESTTKEDIFTGLFTELGLMRCWGKKGEELFAIENRTRENLAKELILYIILDNEQGNSSISVSQIENNSNNVGSVLAMNRTGVSQQLESIANEFPSVVYSDHAGIKELQIKERISPFEVLRRYYAN